ncbi:hypothetical protein JNM87_03760 [Candidatus Saccharibacteria bacterium]|nr:hypothetical protein [Candidatus Saccharibacteria bacterium]
MGDTVLQVNGKSYDAVTGRRIDGMIAPKKQPKATVKAAPKQVTSTQSRPVHITVTRVANHTKPHNQQRAQTLMRKAVKKPTIGLKKQLHVQSELAHKSSHSIVVKHSANHIDPARAHHAGQIEKHAQVHRFHSPQPVSVTFASVPVRHAPDDPLNNNPPAIQPPASSNNPTDMFEQAIQNATHYVDIAANKAHFKKKARRHTVSVAAGTLALIIIGGFMTYVNTPGLQLKIAGIRAGVATNTPNFVASGFAYDGVTVDGNQRVIGLTSGGADFALTQEATSWTTEQMIRQIASVNADGSPAYHVVKAGNDTAYRFGDGAQATWVKNGIWYQLSGNSKISDDQLRALVANS